jgi:hypothetical protein
MANEYYYCVSLSIVHPSVDPKSITAAITCLKPKVETMAGTERRRRDGTLIVPNRKAQLSHWLAELHQEKRLYSGDTPISDFIFKQLDKLEKHRALFDSLRQEGIVALDIGWFSESNYSADVLNAEMLKKCGDLGIDIELNLYSRSSSGLAASSSPS